ncbi:Cof-type HAD-IIB family hydrolase [Enterococcus sp. AD013-P3]|uniref:Cof-type HAD-IIB family hydrolase n=1 Tax=Enterococcus sp. AD013-P3 TaxID=3411036 RepID=UPI003B94B47E
MSQPHYKIAFFDIDGTLADNELPQVMGIYARIPESARQALRKLKENGIEPVIATGRNYQAIHQLAEKLGVESVISSNGAHVVYQGKTLVTHRLGAEILTSIQQELTAQGLPYLVETPHQLYSSDLASLDNDGGVTDIASLAELGEFSQDVIQVICHSENSSQITLSLPEVKVEKVAPTVVDIHLAEVSKATGIHEILAQLAIPAAAALAFGDEENDFAMFETVGMPVAMGNAASALKEKAGHITSKVSEHGIWEACLALQLFEGEKWPSK